MSELIEAYPLCWPPTRKRVTYRETARFDTTFGKARDLARNQISLLGGKNVIISSNVPLRQDGVPYAKPPGWIDPAVAVYFNYKKRQMCFACDRWNDVADNMQAIAKTIEALRGVARWGTGDMMEAAFTGFAALPAPGQTVARAWRDVLEVPPDCSRDLALAQYRRLSSAKHPDKPGGSHDAMSELNWAWAQAQEALK